MRLCLQLQTAKVSWSVGRSAVQSCPVRGSAGLNWSTTWSQANVQSLTSPKWSRLLCVPSSHCLLPSYMTTGWRSTWCMSSLSTRRERVMIVVMVKESALRNARRPVCWLQQVLNVNDTRSTSSSVFLCSCLLVRDWTCKLTLRDRGFSAHSVQWATWESDLLTVHLSLNSDLCVTEHWNICLLLLLLSSAYWDYR